jgi:hypothetical protein
VVRVREPLTPLIVNGYVPAAVLVVVEIVKLELANAPSASPTDALRCPGEPWAGRDEDDGPDESGAAVVAFMGLAEI